MSAATRKSQKDMILEWLETHGSITPMEAQRFIGSMRLGARICELRKEGHAIITENVIVPTRNGGRAVIARYRLAA